MIDLHMHTKYSDGTDSALELLKKVNDRNLEVISVTDHNSCLFYRELETFDYGSYYKGKIIVGCEFTTSFLGGLIEVLGYGFDYREMENFLERYYSSEKVKTRKGILYNRLITKINDWGLIYDKEKLIFDNLKGERMERTIYEELIKQVSNKEFLEKEFGSSFHNFYRGGLTNPDSSWFLNYGEFYPALEEVIGKIHRLGGIVFLAHPFQYCWKDVLGMVNRMCDLYELDGIECFHTTFSRVESQLLLDLVKRRKLLIAGGSDYHGYNKKNHELGCGRGNLRISSSIIDSWKVNFF